MWYNGHGIDIGKLHKGYWMPVKPDWYCGCGEYGAEGLECAEVMKQYYPKEWLAEPFDPHRIVNAQTGDLHYFFYDTPNGMEEWIEKSQTYQAFATAMMTEAFRRNREMISNAIHLFIDAWPSGWMKTIMDCKRNPQKAYFAYKNALELILISLRTDRFTVTSGEAVRVETILCNDTNRAEDNVSMHYEVYEAETPLLYATFTAEGFTPVVISGNKDANGAWKPAAAVGIKEYEGKYYVLSQLDLRTENPAAKRLLKAIYDYTRS